MMSSMPLETCWAFNKRWSNKFYYKVASCWLFLLIHTTMHGSMDIKKKLASVWKWLWHHRGTLLKFVWTHWGTSNLTCWCIIGARSRYHFWRGNIVDVAISVRVTFVWTGFASADIWEGGGCSDVLTLPPPRPTPRQIPYRTKTFAWITYATVLR